MRISDKENKEADYRLLFMCLWYLKDYSASEFLQLFQALIDLVLTLQGDEAVDHYLDGLEQFAAVSGVGFAENGAERIVDALRSDAVEVKALDRQRKEVIERFFGNDVIADVIGIAVDQKHQLTDVLDFHAFP